MPKFTKCIFFSKMIFLLQIICFLKICMKEGKARIVKIKKESKMERNAPRRL